MTDQRLDQMARQWLELGPTLAPEEPVQAALLEVQGTPQARSFRLRLRLPRLTVSGRLAIGTAVVVIAVVGFSRLPLDTGVGGSGASPVPTPSPSPSAMPTSAPTSSPAPIDTTAWLTFNSDRFGFSMRHPTDWVVAAASRPWDLKIARDFLNGSGAWDNLSAPSGNPKLGAFSMLMPADMTQDEFITSFSTVYVTGCFPDREQWTAIAIDGNPAWLMSSTCGAYADALTFAGGRVYGFTMWDRAQYPDGPLFRTIL